MPPRATTPPPVMMPVVLIVIELFARALLGMAELLIASEFAPGVSVIPLEPVMVANAGAPPVLPIRTWPFVPAAVIPAAEAAFPKTTPF